MNVLFFFLPLIVASIAQSHTCTSEAANASRHCYLTHLRTFGYTQIPTSDDFVAKLTEMRDERGVEAHKNICKWFHDLDFCITPVVGGCNNIEGYLQIFKPDDTSAGGYYTFYTYKKFQCNEGYDSFIKTFNCISSVKKNRAKEVEKCNLDFESLSPGDPASCS